MTHALLVPTMLARVVAGLRASGAAGAATPTLRSLAYGGARMPRPVLEEALRLFPSTGFVNAYGLTETASSIAVLGPDDHRRRLSRPIRPSGTGSRRWDGRCQAWNSRSATRPGRPRGRGRPG